MDVRPGSRQTEVGVIPEDWEVAQLGTLIEYTKGYPFKSSEYSSDGVRVIRVSDTSNQSILADSQIFVTERKASQYAKWRLSKNDLVISTVGSKPPMYTSMVGKVILIPQEYEGALLNQNAVVIRDKKKRTHVQNILLNHLRTKRYLKWIEAIFRGNANQASITLKELFEFKVALPTTDDEQRTIAEALSDADAFIESLKQLIAKKRDLKQGTMQELLTGKKRLPSFSGEWGVKSLSDLFVFSGGFSASRDQLSSDGYCYLHYGDIHTLKKSFVDIRSEYQDIPKLNIPLNRISRASLLEDGDIVFVDASEDEEGASKHVVIVNADDIPFISGLHTIVAKSKTNALGHQYRRYCFQTAAVKAQFRFFAVGTKVLGINKTNIAKVTLPLPSVAEQTAIAAILSDIDAEIDALEAKLAKVSDLKQGMTQELLTGRIRLV